eukprot:1140635-Pelagomonas_calceolata.AAC.10
MSVASTYTSHTKTQPPKYKRGSSRQLVPVASAFNTGSGHSLSITQGAEAESCLSQTPHFHLKARASGGAGI